LDKVSDVRIISENMNRAGLMSLARLVSRPSQSCRLFREELRNGELDDYIGRSLGSPHRVKPGADGVKPGADGVKPGADGVKPGADGVKPGADGVKPGADGVKPGADGVKPGADGVKPCIAPFGKF
jgi:hypothetical protein